MHAPVSLPSLWMQVPAASDDDIPASSRVLDVNTSRSRISRQTFPPTSIYGMDAKRVLQTWSDSFSWLSAEDDKPKVIHNMLDAIEEVTNIFRHLHTPLRISRSDRLALVTDENIRKRAHYLLLWMGELEIVCLMAKDAETFFLESGSSAVDTSVLGLATFSRGQLKDDSRGSLREVFEQQFKVAGRLHSRARWDVFAIEGVADAPGLSERSARVLLSKIQKYARKEQTVVVLPAWARISRDGRDLTDYYVRLGFERVEMEDGDFEYIYADTSYSAEDAWVENQQIMVGLSFRTGT